VGGSLREWEKKADIKVDQLRVKEGRKVSKGGKRKKETQPKKSKSRKMAKKECTELSRKIDQCLTMNDNSWFAPHK
jgi:hypothetical protein